MKTLFRKKRLARLIRLALALGIFISSWQVAAAQDLKSQVESLKAFLKEKNMLSSSRDDPVSRYLEYLSKLIELKSDAAALKASISASGCFDNGRYSTGAVDTKASISRASYPHTLRFKAASKFFFSPSSIQNELTSILINYDYYLNKNVEAYGFIERFSDSFMSIKQRYESGFGFLIEFDAKPRGGSTWEPGPSDTSSAGTIEDQDASTKEKYLKLKEEFQGYLKSRLNPDDMEKILQFLRDLDKEYKHTKFAVLKKKSPFTWGIACSLFSEVEQAEIYTGTVDPETQKEIIVPIDPSQFFRLTLRPYFHWRLSDVLSLNSQFYWKGSLRKIKSFFEDSRLDIFSTMEFSVAKDFSVSIDYQFHYDRMPPVIPDEQIQDYQDRNIVLTFVRAGKFHNYLAVRFNLAF